jgi:hypothetical protein
MLRNFLRSTDIAKFPIKTVSLSALRFGNLGESGQRKRDISVFRVQVFKSNKTVQAASFVVTSDYEDKDCSSGGRKSILKTIHVMKKVRI